MRQRHDCSEAVFDKAGAGITGRERIRPGDRATPRRPGRRRSQGLRPCHGQGRRRAVRRCPRRNAGKRPERLPEACSHSPVVTTMVAYKVGSSDEELDQTGLSHYLEHLMFKGTEKIKPGDIDHLTLQNGGANNAYTDGRLHDLSFRFRVRSLGGRSRNRGRPHAQPAHRR